MLMTSWLIMSHTGATMTIPHHVNESESAIRGIKPGWYAMEDDGKLSSGPFSSREECVHSITQAAIRPSPSHLHLRPM